jgi:hypothetical protein
VLTPILRSSSRATFLTFGNLYQHDNSVHNKITKQSCLPTLHFQTAIIFLKRLKVHILPSSRLTRIPLTQYQLLPPTSETFLATLKRGSESAISNQSRVVRSIFPTSSAQSLTNVFSAHAFSERDLTNNAAEYQIISNENAVRISKAEAVVRDPRKARDKSLHRASNRHDKQIPVIDPPDLTFTDSSAKLMPVHD